MKKTTFTWREWHYTQANESLFDLTKEELFVYRLIIKGAP